MPKSYSPESTHIKPTKINKETLAARGRLIRAFAEIEDLLTLHICNLTSVPEGRIIVLLGRTAMSKRLEIAEYFATTAGRTPWPLTRMSLTEHSKMPLAAATLWRMARY